ncbi:MAG: PilZ domain-containing protein [Pseudomonadota bacterium]
MALFGKSKQKLSTARMQQVLRSAEQQTEAHSQIKRNKRSYPRMEIWQRCVIINDEGHRLDGIILDYSQSGSRVRFRTHQSLPPEMILNVPTMGINHRVRTVWQSQGDAGLAFI